MRRTVLLLALLPLWLVACAPRLARPAPPTAQLAGVRLVAIDPFADRFALEFRLHIRNPNPYDLPLTESELKVRLGSWTSAATLPALTLPAGRTVAAVVRVESALTPAAGVARAFFEGRTLPLTLTGRLRVEALGRRFWLGPVTLLSDRVQLPLTLAPPRLTLRAADISLEGGRLALTVRFDAENPLPVGFALSGKLQVRVAGMPVGAVPVGLRLPPGATREGQVRVEVALAQVPGAAAALAAGAPFTLSGTLRAEVPGIYAGPLALDLAGRAR